MLEEENNEGGMYIMEEKGRFEFVSVQYITGRGEHCCYR